MILEGILYANWYEQLFQNILSEYAESIFAYYYDLSFEETLKRHQTKPNCNDFGENEMRRWWREKDYLKCISEKQITANQSIEEIVEWILEDVLA